MGRVYKDLSVLLAGDCHKLLRLVTLKINCERLQLSQNPLVTVASNTIKQNYLKIVDALTNSGELGANLTILLLQGLETMYSHYPQIN